MTARRPGVRLAAALLLLAGSALPATAAPLVLTDHLRREVRLAGPPARIVSLAPNLTEIVFALGLGDRLVGVTDFCDYPPDVQRIPRVGGVATPSLERVVAARPDLVLATTAGNDRERVLALARLGVPVLVTDPRDLAAVADSFVLIARAAGAPEAGERLAADFRARLDALRQRLAGVAPVRTLLLVWSDPLVAAGPGAFLSNLLEVAGATNVLAGTEGIGRAAAYPAIGLETVLTLAPEAIVLVTQAGASGDALARLRRYREIPAVRDGRLVTLEQAAAVRPGPRLPDAAAALARALHPARFA
ncbi:MAG TPA: helical backbone metal receptor, partial [Thermodesulfobacteriota bacterium]|nr:helical backbone metal receptor [Thermodesulfobacteriota bacterium]